MLTLDIRSCALNSLGTSVILPMFFHGPSSELETKTSPGRDSLTTMA